MIKSNNICFRINRFIELRLEAGKTQIYVNGEKFILCKQLLINIPLEDLEIFDNINSIDEAVERYESQSVQEFIVDSETEFWGHCSNLQAWYENNYDPRLLHSNLSYPLLDRLVKVGDLLAKQVIKEEIAFRIINGNINTLRYYIQDNFLEEYFTYDELGLILGDVKDSHTKFVLGASLLGKKKNYKSFYNEFRRYDFLFTHSQMIKIRILTKEERNKIMKKAKFKIKIDKLLEIHKEFLSFNLKRDCNGKRLNFIYLNENNFKGEFLIQNEITGSIKIRLCRIVNIVKNPIERTIKVLSIYFSPVGYNNDNNKIFFNIGDIVALYALENLKQKSDYYFVIVSDNFLEVEHCMILNPKIELAFLIYKRNPIQDYYNKIELLTHIN